MKINSTYTLSLLGSSAAQARSHKKNGNGLLHKNTTVKKNNDSRLLTHCIISYFRKKT